MAIEIERKFRVVSDSWRRSISGSEAMVQAYLANTETGSVRVRIAGSRAWLNIKGMRIGPERPEFEYAIPLADARELMTLCAGGVVEKTRHIVEVEGHRFEVDEFEGQNQGLVVAELELAHVDADYPRPAWLGAEVTDQARYYNIMLAEHPYQNWTHAER